MKKQIALYLLLILVIFLISCNDAAHSEAMTEDTAENLPKGNGSTDEDSSATDDLTICILPSYPEYSLNICDLAIVEWGDVVDLDIYHEDANESDEYVGIGVNYIKTFDSTSYLTSDILRERILSYPERRYAFIDAEHREAFMQNHEDMP